MWCTIRRRKDWELMRHETEPWHPEAQNNNLLIPAAEATEKAEQLCNVFVS